MLKLVQGGQGAAETDFEEKVKVRSQEIARDLQGCLEQNPGVDPQFTTLGFLIRRLAVLELARQ